ncbi:HemK methyltransferase member 1 [Bulinus truncatus]|nr:HemK methyltransferase member 1 [Bulinus truncatus]
MDFMAYQLLVESKKKHLLSREVHCISFSAARASRRKLQDVLRYWTQKFQTQNIGEPDVSASYIVAHILGRKTMCQIDQQRLLTESQVDKIDKLCQLRLTSMPVQYVLGEWDFLDMTLKMKPPVLIPRPETEELATLCFNTVLKESAECRQTALEVGCGSGVLSLSLLRKFPMMHIVAVDITREACSLTLENAELLAVKDRLQVYYGDFLSNKTLLHLRSLGPFDLIVSNPPYLTTNEIENLQPEIKCFEDHVALDGGKDGLDIVRDIILKSVDLLKDKGHLWLEVSPQHPALIAAFLQENLQGSLCLNEVKKDMFGKNRFCHLQKKQTD